MMSHRKTLLLAGVMMALLIGCDNSTPPDKSPPQPSATQAPSAPQPAPPKVQKDWYGDQADKLVHLDQGWTAEQRKWFYITSQGSELVPYAYFMALEQPDSTTLFRDAHNMRRFRWIMDYEGSQQNAGLPLGFARSRDGVGLTCSACHTTQINYKGTGIRVDGAPAMVDFEAFLDALNVAFKATLDSSEKFERFAKAVLKDKADDAGKKSLRADLEKVYAARTAASKANQSDTRYGFARLDAFGRIFNRALRLADPNNGNPASAPVSYPVLWDTPQHDWVQWDGFAANAGSGSLQRNVGQLVGVFAHVELNPDDPRGYASSIQFKELLYMEREIAKLQSPQWPEKVLGALDQAKLTKGKGIYEQQCARCHAVIDRASPDRRVQAQMHRLEAIKTDPTAAQNIVKHAGSSGVLKGKKEQFSVGNPLGPQALAMQIVSNLIAGLLQYAAVTDKAFAQELGALQKGAGELPPRQGDLDRNPQNPLAQLLAYKARPLNGVWASAPYLHNGSVPTLADLLLPPEQRPKTFWVGRRAFDPKKVGFVTERFEGGFELDTSKPGNANSGHLFGTTLSAEDRDALLEYLKSL